MLRQFVAAGAALGLPQPVNRVEAAPPEDVEEGQSPALLRLAEADALGKLKLLAIQVGEMLPQGGALGLWKGATLGGEAPGDVGRLLVHALQGKLGGPRLHDVERVAGPVPQLQRLDLLRAHGLCKALHRLGAHAGVGTKANLLKLVCRQAHEVADAILGLWLHVGPVAGVEGLGGPANVGAFATPAARAPRLELARLVIHQAPGVGCHRLKPCLGGIQRTTSHPASRASPGDAKLWRRWRRRCGPWLHGPKEAKLVLSLGHPGRVCGAQHVCRRGRQRPPKGPARSPKANNGQHVAKRVKQDLPRALAKGTRCALCHALRPSGANVASHLLGGLAPGQRHFWHLRRRAPAGGRHPEGLLIALALRGGRLDGWKRQALHGPRRVGHRPKRLEGGPHFSPGHKAFGSLLGHAGGRALDASALRWLHWPSPARPGRHGDSPNSRKHGTEGLGLRLLPSLHACRQGQQVENARRPRPPPPSRQGLEGGGGQAWILLIGNRTQGHGYLPLGLTCR